MSRAQAQYLRLFTVAGATLYRWQKWYRNSPVIWKGQQWFYQQFDADGFADGVSGDETSMTVEAPATPLVVAAFEMAIREGLLIELETYEFNDEIDEVAPQDDQRLTVSVTAQVIGGSATVSRMKLQVGSALSPIGAQYPPRTFTSTIMGAGCQL